jgi:hypothetical protein
MFFNSRGNKLWDTMKETVNFLSSTKTGTSSGEWNRDGDIGGTIKGDSYHWIRNSWYSEFKVCVVRLRGGTTWGVTRKRG